MVETRPRGEEPNAAGWDGVERRQAAARGSTGPRWSGRSAWRSPDRMRGRILAGVTRSVVTLAVLKVFGIVTEYAHVILR
ncbi:hypothetical protein [Kitasatospora sp. MBT66]|uniref:hypothetical protein n=1 Tax=Kitasatospora sp. MBT66 TaxID=1444769 RepID=UPI0005B9B298|nr:hypothetical protein [Kitasatospora sp. MBT66]